MSKQSKDNFSVNHNFIDFDPIIRMNPTGNMPGVTQLLGLAKSTIYLKIQKGELPPPIKIGARASGWRLSVIEKVRESQEATANYKAEGV